MIGGLTLLQSDLAVKPGGRNFPPSRNRSRRIHKKLVQRHGGEFRMVPTIIQMGNTIVTHPTLYYQVAKEIERRSDFGRNPF